MSAISPLLGAQQTSGEGAESDASDAKRTPLEMFVHGPIRKSMFGATFITALKTHAPTRSVNGIETTENSSGYPHSSDNAVALFIHASASTELGQMQQVASPFRWACKAICLASSSE